MGALSEQDYWLQGNFGERLVRAYLQRRWGFPIEPWGAIDGGRPTECVFDKEGRRYTYVPPDYLVITADARRFGLEVKCKHRWAWWASGRCFRTGIELVSLRNYQEAERITGVPVYLAFLQWSPDLSPDQRARWFGKDEAPPTAPTGIFGGWLRELEVVFCEGVMQQDGHCVSMVYWSRDQLEHLVPLSDLLRDAARLLPLAASHN